MNLKQKKQVQELTEEFDTKLSSIEGVVGKKFAVEANFDDFFNEEEKVTEGLWLYGSALGELAAGLERIGDLHGKEALEGINAVRLEASSATESPSGALDGDKLVAKFRISDRSSGFWWDKMDTADFLENNL